MKCTHCGIYTTHVTLGHCPRCFACWLDVTMAEELASANGNHRAAFCNACDARGRDKRTKQFRFWDAVVSRMMVAWSTQLN